MPQRRCRLRSCHCVLPLRDKHGRPTRKRFCGPAHYELWRLSKRRRRLRRRKHNGFVLRLRNEVKGRVCLMCQTEPLRGNQRVMCSRHECKRAYMAEYKREQRAAIHAIHRS